MAYIDPDELERNRSSGAPPASGAGAPAAVGATPAPSAAPTTPAAAGRPGRGGGTGFVNLERYLGANQGAGQAMANQVAGNINTLGQQTQGQIDALRGQSYRSTAPTFAEINPDLFKKAGENASLVGAQANMAGGSGVGTLLQDHYGAGGGYGSGMRGFDAFLTRAEGSGTLDPLAGAWGGLQKQLGAMEGNYRPSSPDAPPAFRGAPSASPRGNTFAPAPGAAPRRPPPRPAGGGADWEERRRRATR